MEIKRLLKFSIFAIILIIVLIFVWILISGFLNKSDDPCPAKDFQTDLTDSDPKTIQRDNCYIDFAVKKKKVSYCYEVYFDNQRLECFNKLAVANNNVDLCRLDSNSATQISKCVLAVALSSNNESICENSVEELPGLTDKMDSCYLAIATQKSDISICENVIRETTRDSCLNSIS